MNTQSSMYDTIKRLEICLNEVRMASIVVSRHAIKPRPLLVRISVETQE